MVISNMMESRPHVIAEDHRLVKRGEAACCRGAWLPYARSSPAGGQDPLGQFLPIEPPIPTPYPIPDTFLFGRRHHKFASHSSEPDKKERKGTRRKRHICTSFFSVGVSLPGPRPIRRQKQQ